MNAKRCPQCGSPQDEKAPEGLCPACLMKAGLGTAAADVLTKPSTSAPQAPSASAPSAPSAPADPFGAPLDLADVRRRFPQLEIIEQIGRGGMGVVFKARQPQLDRLVALKILPAELARVPGFAERFTREARALARLNHPNIVSVFDFGQQGDLFYFIMEFVDGANLGQMIAAKQITPETALALVPKICEALQFAHDEGILHRDIKPANILVDKRGRVKIADFGLAKLVGATETDHSLTLSGVSMGTPRYMAPEQFENTKTVDHRADIYSLGVVFYEMLTGELPMGRFALPSKKVQVDVRIDEVVLHSLEKEPEQRYQHVSEIKTDVENITQHAVRAPTPVPPAPAVVPPPVRPGGFWTTPQPPEWVRSVSIPTLIVCGIFAVALIAGLFVEDATPLGRIGNLAGSYWLPVLMITFFALNIRYVIRRNKALAAAQAGGAARAESTPVPASTGAAVDPAVRSMVVPPAIAMLLVGVIAAILGVSKFLYWLGCILGHQSIPDVLTSSLLVIAGGIVAVLGATSMLRMKSLPWAFAGCVGLLVGGVLPNRLLAVVALPAAIWAIVVLLGAKVQAAFGIRVEPQRLAAANEARPRIKGPAVALLLLGLLDLVGGIVFFSIGMHKVYDPRVPANWQYYVPELGFGALSVVVGVISFVAALRMLRLRGRRLAFAAAIMAFLPLPPLYVVGIIVGIWVLTTLRRPDVLAAFAATNPSQLPAGGNSGDAHLQAPEKRGSRLGRFGLWLAIAGLILGVLILFLLPKHGSGTSGGSGFLKSIGDAVNSLGAMMSSRAVITEDASSENPQSALYRTFRYRVTGPANQRATFWVECWRNGALEAISPGLTHGRCFQLPRGKGFDGYLEYKLGDGEKLSPDSSGKLRWDMTVESRLRNFTSRGSNSVMKIDKDDTSTSAGEWIANPFAGIAVDSTWGQKRKWSAAPGVPVTLLILRGGDSIQAVSTSEDENIAKKHKVCLMIKARFDPIPAAEQKEYSTTTSLSPYDIKKLYPQAGADVGATLLEAPDKFEIKYDKTLCPSVSAPGRQDYAFAFRAPTGQVLSVWMESWQDGKCEIGRLDETVTAKTNEPINGVLHFSLADGATMSAESAGKKRYDWTIELTKTREAPVKGTETVKWDCGEWRKDILGFPGAMFVGGLDNDVYNNSCHPKSGETVTLLWVDTYDPGVGSVEMNRHSSLCQVPLLQGKPKAAIALRARFSPAAPGELKSGYCDAGLQVRAAAALVTPAQFAIATEIGSDLRLCKTPAEATDKLVATAGTPDGRNRAEQMLRELGGTVIANAAPEVLIKALDAAASKCATKSPVAPAQKPGITATDVLRQMGEKYAGLSYFSASGQVIFESTLTNGGKAIQRQSTFSINLARPEFYRVIWTNADSPAVTRLGAVWSAGDGHRALVAGKVGNLLNREQALGAAAYPSGGLRNVPGLFFKDNASNFLQSLKNAILLPEQTVGTEVCYVVAANRSDGRSTYWITKKDALLKRMQTSGDVVPPRETMVVTNENTDETLRKLLKTMGQDSTPDAVNKMKRQIADGLQRGISSPYTFTTVFETIKVNELLIKEDFEFSPPEAPAQLPASANPVRPPPSADQIRLEDAAVRLLAAMRDKEDKVLREMSADVIKAWPDALPMFAGELREKYRHEFGKPMDLWPAEFLVEGDYAVVRCTSKETESKLNGWYLGLFFVKGKDGAWRNASLRGATPEISLAVLLASFKEKDLPAAPGKK